MRSLTSLRAWLRRTERFWDYLLGGRQRSREAKPQALQLEDRIVPDGRPLPFPVIAVGPGTGAGLVRMFDAETGAPLLNLIPYQNTFLGGIRVAVGDLTHDQYPDVVTAPGFGGGPHVRVFDGKTGLQIPGPLGNFFAYEPSFHGGVQVATGDVTGDGWADLVTAADKTGGPHVKVFDGQTGKLVQNFFAFEPEFLGGVRVAVGELTGVGPSELVLAAGVGGAPRVRTLDAITLQPIAGPLGDFFAFDSSERGGVWVAAGDLTSDVTGDGRSDLVAGAGIGRDPEVRVFDGVSGQIALAKLAYAKSYQGGVRVATAYINDDPYADVVAGTVVGVPPQVRTLDGKTGKLLDGWAGSFDPGVGSLLGGATLAAGNDPGQVQVTAITLTPSSPVVLVNNPLTVMGHITVSPSMNSLYGSIAWGDSSSDSVSDTFSPEVTSFDYLVDHTYTGTGTRTITWDAWATAKYYYQGFGSASTTVVSVAPPPDYAPPYGPGRVFTPELGGGFGGAWEAGWGGAASGGGGDGWGGTTPIGAWSTGDQASDPLGGGAGPLPIGVAPALGGGLEDGGVSAGPGGTAADDRAWLTVGVGPVRPGNAWDGLDLTGARTRWRTVDPIRGGIDPLPGVGDETGPGGGDYGAVPDDGSAWLRARGRGWGKEWLWSGYSQAGVRYIDGAFGLVEPHDVRSEGFELPWGQDRSWTNDLRYSANSVNGNGWLNAQQPHLLKVDGALVFLADAVTATYFDGQGSPDSNGIYATYQARHGSVAVITYDSSNLFVLDDGTGTVLGFNGFGSYSGGKGEIRPLGSGGAAELGALRYRQSPGGLRTEVTERDDLGRPTKVERSAVVNGTTVTERYALEYLPRTSPNRGFLWTVTLERQVGSGSWTTIRKVEYDYYTAGESYGNLGDLRRATITDGTNVLDQMYYRYYTADGGTGYKGGLKYTFGTAAYAQLKAAVGGTDAAVDVASDSTVDDYADRYIEYTDYDDVMMVSRVRLAGAGNSEGTGQGDYTYTYSGRLGADGYNSWAGKTVETLPDGNTNTIYTNEFGQVMLVVHEEVATETKWRTYRRYDDSGRVILTAGPAAVTGHTESADDLVNYQSGNAQYLSDSAGRVATLSYATATTASATTAGNAAGFPTSSAIQPGETGTAVPQAAWTYFRKTQGYATVTPVATDTVYRATDGTSSRTATNTYTWFTNTVQPQTVAATLPTVTTAQNGPNSATTSTVAYDLNGRSIWLKDAGGYLSYVDYDVPTGGVTKVITDVDTSQTTDFAALPSGWATPSGGGLHIKATYVVDALARPTSATNPLGHVTYLTYNDPNHELRAYRGWDTTTTTATEPTVVYRVDRPKGYVELLTMSATPTVASGKPTGAEAISSIQSVARVSWNAARQVVATDVYFDLTALTYTTATSYGTEGTHYLRSRYAYDVAGRPSRTQSPGGAITRTVFDANSRPLSQWVGTDDTPTTGTWSPTNTAGTDLVNVAAYQYDSGGVGHGNLTQFTLKPGGTERVTQLWYDWRDRPTAVKGGVETSETTLVNRPYSTFEYDNLNQVTRTSVYDGDGVSSSPSSSLLRGRSEYAYDELGRVYLVSESPVDQSNGTTGTAYATNVWYDNRGLPVKVSVPGGLVVKAGYDGAARPTTLYLSNGGGDTAWTDALNVTGDTVYTQYESGYDAASNVTLTTARERVHGQTGTGALGTPTSGVLARVSYAAYYYDLAERLTAAVDVGTNGGTAWTRPSSVPSSSDTTLVTTYGYSAAGIPTQVTAADGTTHRTAYDLLGRATSRTLADGASEAFTTSYGYDAAGRLTGVTEPGTRTTRYAYDGRDRLTGVTERHGTALARTTTYALNAIGEVTSITDPASVVTAVAYNVLGRLTSVADAAGTGLARTMTTGYDVLGRVTSVTDPRGNTTSIAYGDLARTTTVTDPLGATQVFAFDLAGNQTAITDGLSKTWSYSYDLLGRLTSASDPLTNTTTYEYNVSGNRDAAVNARGNRTELTVDRFGRPDSVIDALSGVTSYGYDRLGRVTSITDPRSTTTAYAYDKLSRVTSVTEAVGYGEQRSTSYAYDAAGDLTAVTDPRSITTRFAHDTAGRVTGVTGAYGTADALSTSYSYDLLDRVTSVTAPGTRVTATAYDLLGRATSVTEGVGTSLSRTTAFAYDANDNLTAITDPLTRTTSFAFDKLNRATLTTEAVGTSVQRTSTTAYDAAGQVTSVTNPRGYTTLFAYDAAGRMTAVTDARTKVTAYAYDANGNLTSVTDPLTHTTTFAYDALDRLTAVTDPLTQVTTAAYDKTGNVTSVTDPLTHTTAFAYDRLNRRTSATNPLTQTTSFAYDANDNLTSVTNPRTAVTKYAYDNLNRLTATTDPVSNTTSFAYNAAGDLSKVTDPATKVTSYGYDALGRLVTVTAPTSGVTTYAYDAGDRVTTITDPLTHATQYGYDALDRVTVVTDALSFATKVGYDANDNVTRVEDAATNVTTFAYDALDRRTAETDPLTKTISYAYDDGSRLTSVTDRLGRTREFGYDAADRRTTEVWKAAGGSVVQTQTFGYDAADRLTSATDPDGNYTMAYDAADRTTSVTEPFGVSLTMGYDAAGNRTSVTDSGGATQTSEYDLADRLTSRRLDTANGDVRADYGYTSRSQVSSVTRYADLSGTTKVGSSSYGYDDGMRVTAITHANASGTTLASFSYAYDLADRVTSVTENGTAVSYGYDKTDQVTSDNGVSQSYDGTGNRTTSGYSTTAGNRLSSDGTWSYTYNDEGQVTGKSKSGTA